MSSPFSEHWDLFSVGFIAAYVATDNHTTKRVNTFDAPVIFTMFIRLECNTCGANLFTSVLSILPCEVCYR